MICLFTSVDNVLIYAASTSIYFLFELFLVCGLRRGGRKVVLIVRTLFSFWYNMA